MGILIKDREMMGSVSWKMVCHWTSNWSSLTILFWARSTINTSMWRCVVVCSPINICINMCTRVLIWLQLLLSHKITVIHIKVMKFTSVWIHGLWLLPKPVGEYLSLIYMEHNPLYSAWLSMKKTARQSYLMKLTQKMQLQILGWFKLNRTDPDARNFKYHKIPEDYMWNTQWAKWTKWKLGYCITHMYTTNPSQGEWHFFCILLHHIPGATDYDLKTRPDGVIHETFKQSAWALGLLDSDDEWDECLKEAATAFMPIQLCSLFLTILLFGEPAKPKLLWDKYKDMMGKDLLRDAVMSLNTPKEQLLLKVDYKVLLILEDELVTIDKCLADFNLPTQDRALRMRPYHEWFRMKYLMLMCKKNSARSNLKVWMWIRR